MNPENHQEAQNPAESPQKPKKAEKTAVRIDNIFYRESTGYCPYSDEFKANKGKIYMHENLSAEEFELFIKKGFVFSNTRITYYDLRGRNCFFGRVLRTRALEFKPSKEMKKKIRKFENFVAGKRGLKTVSKGKRGSGVVDLGAEGVRIVAGVEELVKNWISDGQLFGVFLAAFGEFGELKTHLKDIQRFVVKKESNQTGIFSNYFTSLFHQNKQKLVKAGHAAESWYPKQDEIGQKLKNFFKNFLEKNEVDAKHSEADLELIQKFELRFDPKRLSFSLNLKPEIIKNLSQLKEEETKEAQKNPIKDQEASEEPPENTQTTTLDQTQKIEENPPKGKAQQENPKPSENASESPNQAPKPTANITLKLEKPEVPTIDNYELVTDEHPFEGPPESTWFKSTPFDIHQAATRKLSTKLVKSTYSTQKYELYNRYNAEIHKELEVSSIQNFKNFICGNNIRPETLISAIDPSQTLELGSYHLEIYLDDTLIGFAEQKILKSGLVTCYFCYEPVLKPLSLGVISALKEIEFVQEKSKFFPEFKFYYMETYIHENSKVNYKANYQPIDIWCPITDIWVPWSDEVVQKLDAKAVRIAGEEDVRRVEGMQGDELKEAKNVVWDDRVMEDLVGYMTQLRSVQDVYLPLVPQLKHFCLPEKSRWIGDKEYMMFDERKRSFVNRLVKSIRVESFEVFRELGIDIISRFDWYFLR